MRHLRKRKAGCVLQQRSQPTKGAQKLSVGRRFVGPQVKNCASNRGFKYRVLRLEDMFDKDPGALPHSGQPLVFKEGALSELMHTSRAATPAPS